MALEGACRRELTKFVAHHRFGDEHGDVLAAVVHRKGMADEVRNDGRPTRPGLDDLLGVLLVLDIDLLEQMLVDERAFFRLRGMVGYS